MKSSIVISLCDNNFFFLQGLQHILKAYFYKKGISVVFIPTLEGHLMKVSMADLIVKRAIAWKKHGHEQHKIVIARSYAPDGGEIFCLKGEVNRSEKPEAVVRLLDELYESSPLPPPNDNVTRIKISAREREILQYIAAELTPNQIAKRLDISTKTVSGHKKRIMLKLGFKRKNDLYNWLLLNGIAIGGRITDATLTHA